MQSIITREFCGKKYRVDESKIKGDSIKSKCDNCKHIIEFNKSTANAKTSSSTSPLNLDSLSEKGGFAEKKDGIPSLSSQKIHFGLTAKVVISMIIISLVPFGLSWGVFFEKSSNQVRVDTEQLMAQTAEGLMNQMDEWLDKNIRVLNVIALLPEVISMNRSQQETILRAVQKEYPWVYLVFTVNPKGMNVARSDNEAL